MAKKHSIPDLDHYFWICYFHVRSDDLGGCTHGIEFSGSRLTLWSWLVAAMQTDVNTNANLSSSYDDLRSIPSVGNDSRMYRN